MSIYIIKDFLVPTLTGLIAGYVFYPVYKKLKNKIKNRNLSALFISVVIILLIIIPIIFTLNALINEANVVSIIASQKLTTTTLLSCKEDNKFFCETLDIIFKDPATKIKFTYYLEQNIKTITNNLAENATNFIFSIPKRMLDIFITIFVTFYIFIDGDRLVKKFERLLPIKLRHREHLVKQFGDVTYALIYGTILVGLLEGAVTTIGFWFSGIASPILWGIIVAFLALIPLIGPTLVWVPATIIQLVMGNYVSAIGVLITGLTASGIDTILRPKIVGNKANIHPVLVLLGVMGGLKLFGFIGVIFGPLVLAFISTFIKIYEKEIHAEVENK